MNNKTIILGVSIVFIIMAVAVIAMQQNQEPEQVFTVNFNLLETNVTEMGLPTTYDVWQIRVYQNNQDTIRNVDVWVNGEIVRHYDYKTIRDAIMEDAKVLSGRGVSVSIYWEGGRESFHSPN